MPKSKKPKPSSGDEISPENRKIIEALIRDDDPDIKEAGGMFVSGKSAKEIRRLRDLSADKRTEEVLGKVKTTPEFPKKKLGSREEIERAYRETCKESTFEGMREDAEERFARLENETTNPKDSFYDNIERGSIGELFFEVLAKKHPKLGVIIDGATDKNGLPIENKIRIEVFPPENKKIIYKLLDQGLLKILIMHPGYKKEVFGAGLAFEGRRELPPGTSKRALARAYLRDLEDLKNNKPYPEDMQAEEEERDRRKIAELNVEPLTDEEIMELLDEMVIRVLNQKN